MKKQKEVKKNIFGYVRLFEDRHPVMYNIIFGLSCCIGFAIGWNLDALTVYLMQKTGVIIVNPVLNYLYLHWLSIVALIIVVIWIIKVVRK
jgi:hypothetical protein